MTPHVLVIGPAGTVALSKCGRMYKRVAGGWKRCVETYTVSKLIGCFDETPWMTVLRAVRSGRADAFAVL